MRNQEKIVQEEQNNPFILTRERFIDACIDNLKKLMPTAVITQEEDDFHWKIDSGDGKIMGMYLSNIWENYSRTKDLKTVTHFIEMQVDIMNLGKDSKSILNMDNVYPVLRTKDFSPGKGVKMKDGKDASLNDIKEDFTDALSIFYVQDHPQFVSFVVESMLENGETTEQLSDKAFENLKKQGWKQPIESMKVHNSCTIHVFESGDSYQCQFMVKDMYQPHLGEHFYFAVPTREIAVVMQWHEKPENLPQPVALGLIATFKKMAVDIYNGQANPLSHVMHRVKPGDIASLA